MTSSKKYELAMRRNCSNKFLGRNVMSEYLEVWIAFLLARRNVETGAAPVAERCEWQVLDELCQLLGLTECVCGSA